EDGIRDRNVTGVQTCALPISVGDVPLFDKNYNWKEQARVLDAIDAVRKQATREMWELLVAHENDRRYLLTFADEANNEFAFNWRSEERRVGKECRIGWWVGH